ncbi:hypothetical protein PFISCL1PPCAC_25055, partial [Pristionchus fissidentatus]
SARLHIVRLHRLDEGGLFTYHYARIRMIANKIQVTFFAKRDVLRDGSFFEMANPGYEHPCVKFLSPEAFPTSFKPIILYALGNEFMIWFQTREGLRLLHYRLTWDGTNVGNGYGIHNRQERTIVQIIPEERVKHIITSDKEVHYFFVTTENENENNVFILKHTHLMLGDFSRIQFLETKMPMDVFPRGIVGNVMPYFSLAMVSKKNKRTFNKLCSYVIAEFFRNQSIDANGKLISDLPEITDPPLALNIFATHFRSAYPFVQSGTTIMKPNYSLLPILL